MGFEAVPLASYPQVTQPFLFVLQSSRAKLLLRLQQKFYSIYYFIIKYLCFASVPSRTKVCVPVALPASVGPGAAALHQLVHPCGKQWVGGNG